MIVSDVTDRIADTHRELTATVEFEGRPRRKARLWLRRPIFDGAQPPVGDPLFAALLIPCMALGEDLTIEAPVSKDLRLAALDRAAPVLLNWFPGFSEAAVACPAPEADPGPGDGTTGCLFSGGVDSFHSFIRNRDRISHVVHIHGFEIRSTDRERWELAHGHVRSIAANRGKAVIPVATNIQEVMLHEVRLRLEMRRRPFFRFDVKAYFGSLLVAVGLSLRPLLSELIIPSSFRRDHPVPEASGPLMEPSWSTPSLRLDLDGVDVDRLGKLDELRKKAPESLDRLRVCVRRWGATGGYVNCGTCVKCVRLRLELRACGIREEIGGFAARPDLRWIRDRHVTDRSLFWQAILDRAAENGDQELRATAEAVMGRRLRAARLRKYLSASAMSVLDRMSLFYRTKLVLDRLRAF